MAKIDKKQLKYYTDLIKDNEYLLLKSDDKYFQNHYSSSPLALLTGFLGSAGEAVMDKNGKITLFVDTRYHLLAPKQIFPEIELYKMDLGESFFDAFEKKYKKETILYVPSDIQLKNYLKLDRHFDLRTYKIESKYLQNNDLSKKAQIFMVDEKIEKNDFQFKLEKLKKNHKDITRMLVFNLDEISYLTNLRSFQSKYSSNFRSILFLDFQKKSNILFVDKNLAKKEIKIENLEIRNLDEFPLFIKNQDCEIYLNSKNVTLDNYLLIKKPKEIKSDKLALFASIKSKSVIEHLKEANLKVDIAIYNFRKKLKAGLSELDLAKLFEQELIKAGAKCLSFKTLLALDENSASIHYSEYSKNKVISGENVILLDCGGYFEGGYSTDITRTFYFGYYPNSIHKKVYTYTLKAFINCILSDLTNARKLDLLAREILKPMEKEGFYFSHGLGHGIGTSVHQAPPTLNMYSTDIIKPYQTHSIEPGLYGTDKATGLEFGVRIENCVYNNLDYKKVSLSKFPFEEILIDYSMLNTNEIEFVKNWQNEWEKTIKELNL